MPALSNKAELAKRLRSIAHGYTLGRRSREHDYKAVSAMQEAAKLIEPLAAFFHRSTRRNMKILTAMIRARDDGTVSSHYRAQHMTGDDVPKMLRAIRDDIDKELAIVENCPAARARIGDGRDD